MAKANLTKRAVESAQASEKPYVLYDGGLPRFGLRIMPSGYKAWILEYRPSGGGRTSLTRLIVLGGAGSGNLDSRDKWEICLKAA
jgi:hypothetical protein